MQENLRLTPGLGRSSGEGNGNPLQYCCLGNLMHRGAWWDTVDGVTRVRHNLVTKLLLLVCVCVYVCVLEKAMATHSSVLAWRIPGTEEPGGLPSMGSHRVRHDWSDLAAAAAGMDLLYSSLSSLISHLTLSLLHQFSLTGSPKCPWQLWWHSSWESMW